MGMLIFSLLCVRIVLIGCRMKINRGLHFAVIKKRVTFDNEKNGRCHSHE